MGKATAFEHGLGAAYREELFF